MKVRGKIFKISINMKPKNYTPIDHLLNSFSSSFSKEAEPIIKPKENLKEVFEIQEMVEHTPEKEITPYVQVRSETIELPPDLKKLGLQPVSHTKFSTYKSLTLPISDDKIIQGLHAPIYSSLRWLATLAMYLLKKAHLTLKVIHGHVVRVVKW